MQFILKVLKGVGGAIKTTNEQTLANQRYLFRVSHLDWRTSDGFALLTAMFNRLNADGSVCRDRHTCPFHGPEADDYLAYRAITFARELATEGETNG